MEDKNKEVKDLSETVTEISKELDFDSGFSMTDFFKASKKVAAKNTDTDTE